MRAYFPFRFLVYLPSLPHLPLDKCGWLLGDFPCRLASVNGLLVNWSMVNGLWSMVYGQLVNGLWAMVNGRWSMVYGQWSMVYGLWSMGDGLWSTGL
jgi:hypothetical protein